MRTDEITVSAGHCTKASTNFQDHPLPHPEPAVCRVIRARESLSEALDALRLVQHELSRDIGTRPERTPEFWLGHLQGLSAYLLITLEAQDAVTR